MSTPASWAMRSELAPLQAIAPRLVTLPPVVSSVTPVDELWTPSTAWPRRSEPPAAAIRSARARATSR